MSDITGFIWLNLEFYISSASVCENRIFFTNVKNVSRNCSFLIVISACMVTSQLRSLPSTWLIWLQARRWKTVVRICPWPEPTRPWKGCFCRRGVGWHLLPLTDRRRRLLTLPGLSGRNGRRTGGAVWSARKRRSIPNRKATEKGFKIRL